MPLNANALEFALRLARIKALQLHRRLHGEHIEDIQQDLLLEVVEGWTRYDASRGRAEPFIESLIRQGAWKALDRHHRRSRVVTNILDDHEPSVSSKPSTSIDVQHDVWVALALLPPEVRGACDCLGHSPVSTAARTLNVPRSTLDSWLHKARSTFTALELHRYRERRSRLRRIAGCAA